MSNLIITILAIAMGAIVTVAGAFYAGNAFLASFYKAQATQLVNYMGTYAQAANVWAQRNGGILPEPQNNIPVNAATTAYFSKANLDSFLVPRFLQASGAPSKMQLMTYLWDEAGGMMQSPVVLGLLGPSDLNICNAIEMMRTGTWPSSLRTFSFTAAGMNAGICGNFGCELNDGSLASAATFPYMVYYRVHGKPNTSHADVDPKTCT